MTEWEVDLRGFNSSVHRAAIALGSNLGDSQTIVRAALKTLAQTSQISVTAHSGLYQTTPLGPPQPDYVNACALLETQLDPFMLLETLLTIEKQFGRVRRERWGPRLLDLDLLLYDDFVVETPTLQIPHPRMNDRAFVLVPLAEVAGDWLEPVTGKAIAALMQRLDSTGVQPLS